MKNKGHLKILAFCSFIFLIQVPGFAQKYVFPVNPGKTSYLTGGLGEIRSNHFHMGMDVAISTGTPVQAAEDGYLYRAKVSTYGYGKVLYIDHPKTGHRTVYAHLNAFNKEIGDFIRQKQYEEESFEVEIFPDTNQIQVRKGQVIGYSGNSGSSGGPHLHYEIRNFKDEALNPMSFGFTEIKRDLLPPVMSKLAINTLDINARVNGTFGRAEYSLKKAGAGNYTISQTIPVYGQIGFELLTHDVMSGSYSIYGTMVVEVFVDGEKVHMHDLNKIAHEYNRCMNVHVNYEAYRKGRQGFQKCYVEDGNRYPNIYQKSPRKGKISILDNQKHRVEIRAKDSYGNLSTLKFNIQGAKPAKAVFKADLSPAKSSLNYAIQENILKILVNAPKQKGDSLHLFFNGICIAEPLAYMQGRKAVYLWDLQKGIPDMLEVSNIQKPLNISRLIPSETDVTYEEEGLKINFPKGALFDTLYIETQVMASSFSINHAYIPLYSAIEISFSPQNVSDTAHTSVYYAGRSHHSSHWKDKTVTFSTRTLGNFILKRDATPPAVNLKQKSPNRLVFFVRDDMTGIQKVKAKLNGEFLLMDYEYKTNTLVSVKKDKDQILKGNFEMEVWDWQGNKRVFQTTL